MQKQATKKRERARETVMCESAERFVGVGVFGMVRGRVTTKRQKEKIRQML